MARPRKYDADAVLPNPRISKDLHERLAFAAKLDRVSLNDTIVGALEAWWREQAERYGIPTDDEEEVVRRRVALAAELFSSVDVSHVAARRRRGLEPKLKADEVLGPVVRAVLDRVLRLDPEHVGANLAMGHAYRAAKMTVHAMVHFRKAAEAGSAQGHVQVAELLEAAGDPQGALRHLADAKRRGVPASVERTGRAKRKVG